MIAIYITGMIVQVIIFSMMEERHGEQSLGSKILNSTLWPMLIIPTILQLIYDNRK